MKKFASKSESIDRYFKSIKNFNPLTKDEEIQLAILAQKGDRRSLNKLVEHNLKIVVTIANKNIGRGIQVDDLIQQGNLGLLDAVHRFDPNSDVRFASFASTRILKSMNQLIDTCGRAVRIPVNQEYKRYLAIKNGEEVENISAVKLDDLLPSEDGKTKADTGILAVDAEVDETFEHEHFSITTKNILGTLKERDRTIIKLYFGIDCDDAMPTSEIAEEVGLTQIRVCQIINSAKKKLKESLELI